MKATTKPQQIPPCVVCDKQGHETQNCHKIPMIHTHLDAMDTTENIPLVELPSGPTKKNKSLRKNHACALCELYENYSHHFQDLSKFRTTLANLRQHALETEISLIK